MEKYKSKIVTNKKIWEKFVLSQSPKSFLQSWEWGEVNEDCGNKVIRMGFFNNEKLVGIAQFIEQNAKRGKHFIVPGGPLFDWTDKSLVGKFMSTAKEICVNSGAWFVRLRPEILDTKENRSIFRKFGFVQSPMHLNAENTWILDISKDPEVLLSEMRKSTRYLIKRSLAEKDFSIERTTEPAKTKVLTRLQVDTVKRHKFVGFSDKLFESQIDRFGKNGNAYFYVAKHKGKAHAAAIIIHYGDTAYYHHSASSNESKKFPIAYRLQWEIIMDAKKRGLKYYNFWGVSPTENPKHRFYGVTIFKKGFGGFQVDWLHAQDMVVSKLYYFTYIFELTRKLLRHL